MRLFLKYTLVLALCLPVPSQAAVQWSCRDLLAVTAMVAGILGAGGAVYSTNRKMAQAQQQDLMLTVETTLLSLPFHSVDKRLGEAVQGELMGAFRSEPDYTMEVTTGLLSGVIGVAGAAVLLSGDRGSKEREAKFAVVALDGSTHLTKALKAAVGIDSLDELRAKVLSEGVVYRQGYLEIDEGVRTFPRELPFVPTEVRVRAKGEKKFILTAKGEAQGATRSEEEAEMSAGAFEALWPLTTRGRIEKHRLTLPLPGTAFSLEIDVYGGALEKTGLITVEVEVPSEEDLATLGDLGLDVTTDKKYKNAALAARGAF